MPVFAKIVTALRGAAREQGEQLVEQNAIRIFEQEIYDAEQNIARAKAHLSQIIVERLNLERLRNELKKHITNRETQIKQLLHKGEQSLAEEAAENILEKESLLQQHNTSIGQLSSREKGITEKIKASSRRIQNYRQELNIAKATNNAHLATRAAGLKANNLHSNLNDLEGSMALIRAKHQRIDDEESAYDALDIQLSETSLDNKIENAGINDKSEKIQSLLKKIADS